MQTARHGRSMLVTLVELAAAGVLAMLFAFPASSGEAPRVTERKGRATTELPGGFVHVAFYTFKADAPEGIALDFVRDAKACFRKIPSVRGFRIGMPAETATPKAYGVQPRGAYHVGVVLCFDGYSGLASYGNHPSLIELKAKYGKHFGEVIAYDFED